MLQINHQNSDVTKTRASGSKITETFMAGRVDDQQSRNINKRGEKILALIDLIGKLLMREESGTNLLSNTSSLSFLNIGLSDLIEKSSFACIHMPQDATHGTPVISFFSGKVYSVVFEYFRLFGLFFLSFPLVFVESVLQFFLSDFFIILFIFLVNDVLVELQLFSFSFHLLSSDSFGVYS